MHHGLAQFEREPLAEMKRHHGEHGKGEIFRRRPINSRQIVTRNRPGDGAADQPRQHGICKPRVNVSANRQFRFTA